MNNVRVRLIFWAQDLARHLGRDTPRVCRGYSFLALENNVSEAKGGPMRALRSRRLDRGQCLRLIETAASLSLRTGFAWKTCDSNASMADILRDLSGLSSARVCVLLPNTSKDWFSLRFDVDEAAYSLAIIYLWLQSLTDIHKYMPSAPLAQTVDLTTYIRLQSVSSRWPDFANRNVG